MTFNYEEIASLDYFDSRDVVERVKLAEMELKHAQKHGLIVSELVLNQELYMLTVLLEKLAEEFPADKWSDVRTDINCGVQGFADHYAEEYVEEFAYDTGAVERGSWVERYIDWGKAAEDLKEDYTGVEILGHTFYLLD